MSSTNTGEKRQSKAKGKGGRRGGRESKKDVSGKPQETVEPKSSSEFTGIMHTTARPGPGGL